MRTGGLSSGLAAMLLACAVRGAEVRVEGGALDLNGGLAAGRLVIESSAVLTGSGRVEGDLTLAGTVAPRGPSGEMVDALSVSGAATFLPGSRFACDASSHTTLDRLDVGGPVTGACQVVLTAAPGAIPVNQAIIRGSAASDYRSFQPQDAWTWRLAVTGSLDLAATHLRGDTDSDGLPDWWEMLYFKGSRLEASPLDNSDDDILNNLQEYVANTDPIRGDSVLRLTAMSRSGADAFAMRWTTAPGRRYGVLRMTNLASSACTTCAVMSVYGWPENTWTNAGEPAGAAYYRIAVEENAP